jgi:hypothetical protein
MMLSSKVHRKRIQYNLHFLSKAVLLSFSCLHFEAPISNADDIRPPKYEAGKARRHLYTVLV